MIRRDYHNFTYDEAMQDVEKLIGDVRMKGQREDAEFITGRGVIRLGLLRTLVYHGLHPKQQLGNDGVIVCVIE